MKSIIGIDPGSEKSAYVQWNGKEILDKGIHPNEELLDILLDDYLDVASIAEDIILAIESMVHIHGKSGKSVIDTIAWIDRFYQAWSGPKELVPRYVVKKALGAKNDSEVRAVLIQRFGAPGTKKNPGFTYGLSSHLWQAFGLAVAHWDHLEFQNRVLK